MSTRPYQLFANARPIEPQIGIMALDDLRHLQHKLDEEEKVPTELCPEAMFMAHDSKAVQSVVSGVVSDILKSKRKAGRPKGSVTKQK